MTLEYFLKRILQFFAIAFLAATINFFLPRLTGQDPIRQKLAQLQMQGGSSGENVKGLVETYNKVWLRQASLAPISNLSRRYVAP